MHGQTIFKQYIYLQTFRQVKIKNGENIPLKTGSWLQEKKAWKYIYFANISSVVNDNTLCLLYACCILLDQELE